MQITKRDIRLLYYLAKDKIPGMDLQDAVLAWQVMKRKKEGKNGDAMTIPQAARLCNMTKYKVKCAVVAAGLEAIGKKHGSGSASSLYPAGKLLAALGYEEPEVQPMEGME